MLFGRQQQRYHELTTSRAAPFHSADLARMDCCMREDGRHELLMPAAGPAPVLPPPDMFADDEDADENGSSASEQEPFEEPFDEPFDEQLGDMCGIW